MRALRRWLRSGFLFVLLALASSSLASAFGVAPAAALGPEPSVSSAATESLPDSSCADALGVRCEPLAPATEVMATPPGDSAVRSSPTVASLPSLQGPLGDPQTRIVIVLLLATAAALLWVGFSVTSPTPKRRRAARISKWTVGALEVFIVACVVTAAVSLFESSKASELAVHPVVPPTDTRSNGGRMSVPSVVATATGAVVHVFGRPDKGALAVETFENPWRVNGDPLAPVPLVFGVQKISGGWVHVLLPTRPNGATGWVRKAEVSLSGTPYRVLIEIGMRRLTVFRDDTVIVRDTVAVGAPESPTPTGHFYMRAVLRAPTPDTVYGPYALALSGFSPTLTSFNGGDGELGIHGNNDAGSLGRDVTHGCVRASNPIITAVAAALPLGVPVEIVD